MPAGTYDVDVTLEVDGVSHHLMGTEVRDLSERSINRRHVYTKQRSINRRHVYTKQRSINRRHVYTAQLISACHFFRRSASSGRQSCSFYIQMKILQSKMRMIPLKNDDFGATRFCMDRYGGHLASPNTAVEYTQLQSYAGGSVYTNQVRFYAVLRCSTLFYAVLRCFATVSYHFVQFYTVPFNLKMNIWAVYDGDL